MIPKISKQQFQRTILQYYKKHGRNFPWRQTHDPYRIMVSEVMLQQTQTSRVVPKYYAWMKRFPTAAALAAAPLSDVLREWHGLGYNRRALALRKASGVIVEKYHGRFPKTYEEILNLPGIGPYTAGAIMAFAFNTPVPIIETNIRTVFIHFFFGSKSTAIARSKNPSRKKIHDRDILTLIEKTLDQKNPREWYHALMDYGVMLKHSVGNLSRESAHYAHQTPFKGSHRQMRAAVLRGLTSGASSLPQLSQYLKKDLKARPSIARSDISKICQDLTREGFLIKISPVSYIIKE